MFLCILLVHRAEVGRGTLDTMVVAGSSNIVREVLGTVMQDMVGRRGNILSTGGQGEGMVVCGHVPLAELRGYSREIRIKTSGRANIAMELSHYQIMSPFHQDKAVEDVTGFSSS